MNWTEGGLARHSRASKSRTVLLRQKEHFAKSRSGLLNAKVKISPPVISFLAHPSHSSSPARPHSSKHHASRSTSSSKKRPRGQDPPHRSHHFQDGAGLDLPTPDDFQKDLAEAEILCEKRRKLLLMGDWTGISLQKPIDIEFTRSRASVDDPWGQPKSRHGKSSMSRLRHMLEVSHGTAYGRTVRKIEAMDSHPFSPRQVKVRVGSREKAVGGSSNASPRSRTYRDEESSPQVARASRHKHGERQKRRKHPHRTTRTTLAPEAPNIHQPVPLRPFLPSILRSESSDSDDAASTKARVGTLLPDVPPSQVEQNEAWRTFVGEYEHGKNPSGLQNSRGQDSPQREISPGISQLGLPGKLCGAGQETPQVHDEASGVHASSVPEISIHTNQLEFCEEDIHLGSTYNPASEQPRSSTMGSSPPLPTKTGRVEKRRLPVMVYDDSEHLSLGVVSQAALSTSSSPTSQELLPQFCKDVNVPERSNYNNIEYAPRQPTVSTGPLPEKPKESEYPPEQSLGVAHQGPEQPEQSREESFTVAHQQLEKIEASNTDPCDVDEDESDMWRKFVCGDFDEVNLQAAFLEATREAARNICPSNQSTSTGEDEKGHENRNHGYRELSRVAEIFEGVPDLYCSDYNGQHAPSSTEMSTDILELASISNRATPGASSSDTLANFNVAKMASEQSPVSNDTNMTKSLSIMATSGGSSWDTLSERNLGHSGRAAQTVPTVVASSSSFKAMPLTITEEFLRRSDAWSIATGDNDNASLIAHPQSTHENSEADVLKFVRPKPFTGRNIKIDEQRQIALSAPQIRGKRVSRRQKRPGESDGRARIRELPNFDGDPIEEVEDVQEFSSAKTAPKPSLFGSLDTEGDF